MAATPIRAEPAPDQAPPEPHNLEAEEYVLGAMMLPGNAIEAVRPLLQPRDFYRESHGRVYRAALDLHDLGIAVDPVTLTDELETRGDLPADGGKDRIREIASLVPAVANAPHHARIVAEAAYFRLIIRAAKQMAQAGWDRDPGTALEIARDIAQGLDERRTPALAVETWHEFESQAHDDIPVLVHGLWPENAFGFIAAAPKKGKTWLALALAIAVATGRPFLEQEVPAAKPVLYVALEGHRAALRARVGAIARGMGLNPDGPDLANLQFIYKPRGLNLADPAWAQRLRQSAANSKARLCIIDVLRAGARIKENDQAEFTNLAHNLAPITQDGCSLAILHHFTKLSEISKERAPGERMSGTGAMFGALDVGIYITGSQNDARELRLEFDTRDIAGPGKLNVELTGKGTGPNGGFTYLDTAHWNVTPDTDVAEDDLKAPPLEIYEYIRDNGGDLEAKLIRAHFEISSETLTRRLGRLIEMGVEYGGGRGRPGRLTIPPRAADEPEQPEQLGLESEPSTNPQDSARPEVTVRQPNDDAETFPHNHAGSSEVAASNRTDPERQLESGDLQDIQLPQGAASYGGAPTRAHTRETAPTDRLADQHAWIDAGGYAETPFIDALLAAFPMTNVGDLETLEQHRAAREAREFRGDTT